VRELSKICGYLEFFIGGVGYDIKFVPELPREKLTAKETPQNDNKPGEGAGGMMTRMKMISMTLKMI
jgi:hypothetical protein